jgi:hypothetical protein
MQLIYHTDLMNTWMDEAELTLFYQYNHYSNMIEELIPPNDYFKEIMKDLEDVKFNKVLLVPLKSETQTVLSVP